MRNQPLLYKGMHSAPAPTPGHGSQAPPPPSSPQYSPEVQVLELLQTADLCGQLLDLVIKKVEHF